MILELNSVTKRFGEFIAVYKLSLSIGKGQIKSLIGPNGAGKTTLFNMISGAFSPDSGDIIFNGHRINGFTPQELCHLGMARSFQITNIFQGLTVFENVRLSVQGLSRKLGIFKLAHRLKEQQAEEVKRILDLIGLWDKRGELAGTIPYSEQRHLEIGIALASRPSLLLLDEPTAGMSVSESLGVAELIKGLHGKVTMLVIEHDIDMVLAISDQIAVLHQGGLLVEGEPAAIKANKEVQDVYLGGEI